MSFNSVGLGVFGGIYILSQNPLFSLVNLVALFTHAASTPPPGYISQHDFRAIATGEMPTVSVK